MAHVSSRTSLRVYGATEVGATPAAHRSAPSQDTRLGHLGHVERRSRRRHHRAISRAHTSPHIPQQPLIQEPLIQQSQCPLVLDVQPPRSLAVGEAIQPELHVFVGASQHPQAVTSETIASGHTIAVASLVEGSEDGSLATPGTLIGTYLANTVQPVSSISPTPFDGVSVGAIGEATFPDLAITTEGIFRLRVSLMQLMGPCSNVSSDPSSQSGGYNTVGAIESTEFTVRGA